MKTKNKSHNNLSIIENYDFVSEKLHQFNKTEILKGENKKFKKAVKCKQNGRELEMWFISLI